MLIIKNKNLMDNFTDAERIIIDLINSSNISGEEVICLCKELYKKEQQTNRSPSALPIIWKDYPYTTAT